MCAILYECISPNGWIISAYSYVDIFFCIFVWTWVIAYVCAYIVESISDCLIEFYGILTIIGYLMPNPILHTHTHTHTHICICTIYIYIFVNTFCRYTNSSISNYPI